MKRLKLSEIRIITILGEADAGLKVKEIRRKHRIRNDLLQPEN